MLSIVALRSSARWFPCIEVLMQNKPMVYASVMAVYAVVESNAIIGDGLLGMLLYLVCFSCGRIVSYRSRCPSVSTDYWYMSTWLLGNKENVGCFKTYPFAEVAQQMWAENVPRIHVYFNSQSHVLESVNTKISTVNYSDSLDPKIICLNHSPASFLEYLIPLEPPYPFFLLIFLMYFSFLIYLFIYTYYYCIIYTIPKNILNSLDYTKSDRIYNGWTHALVPTPELSANTTWFTPQTAAPSSWI